MTTPDALGPQPTPGEQLSDVRRQMFEDALATGALVETQPEEGPGMIAITVLRRIIDGTFRADHALIDPATGRLIAAPELQFPDLTVQDEMLAWVREKTGWAPDAHDAWLTNAEGFSFVRTLPLVAGRAEIAAAHAQDDESILMTSLSL